MSLPRSVQKQADEAQAHFDSLKNPAPAAPEAEEKTPDAPDTAAQPVDTLPNAESEKHSQGDNKTPTDEPKRSEAYWEHRFNVINGKYAAEVPALRREVEKLTQQLNDKNREIETLKASTQPSNPGGLSDEQLAEFKEQFGEDFVTFVERMISSKTAPQSNAKVEELERKVEQFEQQNRQRTEAGFWTALTELVPEWRTLNADQNFHAFLAQYDPQTGTQRQQALTTAQQALDADGVAAVFNAFKKQQPAPKPRIPDDQVDPQTSRATDTPQGQKIWTSSEIKQFYKDKSAGKYSADEGQRLEADIFAAQREGRIR